MTPKKPKPERRLKGGKPIPDVQQKTGFKEVKLEFPDEFAPEEITYNTDHPENADDPVSNIVLHNSNIDQVLAQACQRAKELGLPSVDPNLFLGFPWVSKTNLQMIFAKVRHMQPMPERNSSDWLSINCYLRWVAAGYLFHSPETDEFKAAILSEPSDQPTEERRRILDAMSVSQQMVLLGADLKELELTLRNRDDALRGKGTARAASAGGQMKAANHAQIGAKILNRMAELIAKNHSVASAGAIAANEGLGQSAKGNAMRWHRAQKRNTFP